MRIHLDLADLGNTKRWTVSTGEYELERREWGSVYKITFLDYDHSVHYGKIVDMASGQEARVLICFNVSDGPASGRNL